MSLGKHWNTKTNLNGSMSLRFQIWDRKVLSSLPISLVRSPPRHQPQDPSSRMPNQPIGPFSRVIKISPRSYLSVCLCGRVGSCKQQRFDVTWLTERRLTETEKREKKNSDNTKSIEILDLIDYFDLLSIVSGEEGGWNIMKIVSHAHVERTIIKLVIWVAECAKSRGEVCSFCFGFARVQRNPDLSGRKTKGSWGKKAIFINVISLLSASVILTFPSKVTHFAWNFYPSAFSEKRKKNQT